MRIVRDKICKGVDNFKMDLLRNIDEDSRRYVRNKFWIFRMQLMFIKYAIRKEIKELVRNGICCEIGE